MASRNVVLVHGGFVDGSGWEGVYKELKRDGYTVSVVQNPTLSLADDVRATIADGRILMDGRVVAGVDEGEVRREFRRRAHALKARSFG